MVPHIGKKWHQHLTIFAKSEQLFAPSQGRADRLDGGVNSLAGVILGQAGGDGNVVDPIGHSHGAARAARAGGYLQRARGRRNWPAHRTPCRVCFMMLVSPAPASVAASPGAKDAASDPTWSTDGGPDGRSKPCADPGRFGC